MNGKEKKLRKICFVWFAFDLAAIFLNRDLHVGVRREKKKCENFKQNLPPFLRSNLIRK